MPRTVNGGRFIITGVINLENAKFLFFGTVIYEIDLAMILEPESNLEPNRNLAHLPQPPR